MVGMAQLASAPDCGSGGRRFEPDYPPHENPYTVVCGFFIFRENGIVPLLLLRNTFFAVDISVCLWYTTVQREGYSVSAGSR